ncbi:hypothetical protein CKM354_000345500 [Cercospora kikuchii]|uniref:NAD-dependent epimerase/dehydratase domain-containing protein n=1 Tax=Cercospora kikuchii TaxID=84275 RepID=A0A9P3CC41_9PEZI|nr:uncharacterized protein CKM354_000345500 [Cercospora kikuchii]GIZ40103.1 hypothetical protein CKM354_000345500 [Cercospora kikuchii]
MRVLVTGGGGYLAGHIINQLLRRGHSVVTTARTKTKAEKLKKRYAELDPAVFDVVIVEDIAKEGAFDEAVVSSPPFDGVCHPTSPFHFAVTELLDPAIIGTTGILKSIKAHAPSVRRVVITSSLAAMIHPWQGAWRNYPGHTYTEADWNPITAEQAFQDPLCGYRFSKKQAEQAAWSFVAEDSALNFTLQTICPPLMLGPTASGDLWDGNLANVNESLKRVRDICFGKARADNEIPPNGASFIFTDVRDAAHYHVLALERADDVSERYFIPTGWFANEDIVRIARENFPDLTDSLPLPGTPGGSWPKDGMYTIDNSKTRSAFPTFVDFRSLEECIIDTVQSLKAVVA